MNQNEFKIKLHINYHRKIKSVLECHRKELL